MKIGGREERSLQETKAKSEGERAKVLMLVQIKSALSPNSEGESSKLSDVATNPNTLNNSTKYEAAFG